MPTTTDPRKEGEALHKTITEVAQAVSEAFYKVDKAMLGLPPGSNMAGPLKTIRDTMFSTKVQAEKMVSQASTELQNIPVTPEEPEPDMPPSVKGASVIAAGVPTVACETIHDLLLKGKEGKAGNLSTDGKVVSLHGNPIFKIEGDKVYGSWGNYQPTPTTAANVNGLALLVGLGTRPFSIKNGQAMANGNPVSDLGAWVEIGTTGPKAQAEPRVASLPNLLAPRKR